MWRSATTSTTTHGWPPASSRFGCRCCSMKHAATLTLRCGRTIAALQTLMTVSAPRTSRRFNAGSDASSETTRLPPPMITCGGRRVGSNDKTGHGWHRRSIANETAIIVDHRENRRSENIAHPQKEAHIAIVAAEARHDPRTATRFGVAEGRIVYAVIARRPFTSTLRPVSRRIRVARPFGESGLAGSAYVPRLSVVMRTVTTSPFPPSGRPLSPFIE